MGREHGDAIVIESAIRAALLADSTVAGLIGDRVYPLVLPQNPTLPAIVYQRIASPPDLSNDGPAGPLRTRLQLTLWASTWSGSRAIAAAVKAVLHGYSGSADGQDVLLVAEANETDGYESETKLFRVIADYYVHTKETP